MVDLIDTKKIPKKKFLSMCSFKMAAVTSLYTFKWENSLGRHFESEDGHFDFWPRGVN